MTSGYEEAKAQRNSLERLLEKIPGFRGFQDRELRRDVDRLQREYLATELGRLKSLLRERSRELVDGGQLAALAPFDRLDRSLDGLAQQIRFSDYGASGLFDAVKIGDAELARLYDFDLSILGHLGGIEAAIAALPPSGAPGAGDPAPALDQVLEQVRALSDRWRQRDEVIGSVVQTGR
jgi:hypothetical protein